MSKSVSSSCTLQVSGDGISITGSGAPTAITQTGTQNIGNTQNIGYAAGEALVLGDVSASIAAPLKVCFKNLDTTNYVMINTADSWTTPQIVLKPGEFACFPTAIATWYAKADTAAVDLWVQACEF